MKSLNITRNIGIDFLRGASILYIVGFWHLLNYTKAVPDFYNFATYRIALIVLGSFIFVSGYFIGLNESDFGKNSIMPFYLKKLSRIYPLYLFSIALYALLNLLDIPTSLKAAFFLSMISGPAPQTLWFITMLMLFYIVSPLFLILNRNFSRRGYFMSCTLIMLLLLLFKYLTNKPDIRIILYFPPFVSGLAAAGKEAPKSLCKNIFPYIFVPIVAFILSLPNLNHDLYDQLKFIPMILIFPYLLFIISWKIDIHSSIVKGIVTTISYSSYCMYLFHRPFYNILTSLYFPELLLFQALYLFAFCLPLITVSSFTIQRSYDTAIATFSRFLSKRNKMTRLDIS